MEMKAFGLFSLLMLAVFLATSATEGDFLKLPVELDGGQSGRPDWCEHCYCTRSIPPQCRCADVGISCYPDCKQCLCTRSIPPRCKCTDVKDHC